MFLLQSCQKEPNAGDPVPGGAKIYFISKFDSSQQRLNGIGQPAAIPAGNAGQSPRFNSMRAHYIELTSKAGMALSASDILNKAPEVNTGGSKAIDFSNSKFAGL